MAKKTKEKQEVSRVNVNGVEFIKYDDGTSTMITTVELDAEQTEELLGSAEQEPDEDEDEDEEEPKGKGKKAAKEEPKGKGKKAAKEEPDEDEDEDEDDEDSDDEDGDEDGDELTPEALAEMDFEELEDLCDENDLDTDPDEFDEDDVVSLRKAIAKELGIVLPKSNKEDKKSGKKGKK